MSSSYSFQRGDRIWAKPFENHEWWECEVLVPPEDSGVVKVRRLLSDFVFGAKVQFCRPAIAFRHYPRRLLIVACSKAKKSKAGVAHEIYDGSIHKVIRKARRENNFPSRTDVLILSAKYGLIRNFDWIETYEQRMTVARSKELRPQVEFALASVAAVGFNETRGLASLSLIPDPPAPSPTPPEPYEEIYVELGKDYLGAIAGLLPQYFPCVPVRYGEGGIGERQSQLLQWLKECSHREIPVGSRVKVLSGNWAGAIGEAVAEQLNTGQLVVQFEEPWDNGSRWDYWDDELELLDLRESFRTPGTNQTWRDLKDWFSITYFHFEAMPDSSHRRNPDKIKAQWHIKELLKTDLIEQCEDPALLNQVSEFFNSKTHNNSAFRLPSRGNRNTSPNGSLCDRLHNQLARLESGKPLKRFVSRTEIAEAKQQFFAGSRIQGPDNQGNWKHGVVLQTHKQGTAFVIRFDDGSFTQRSITKLLQDGFKMSDEPLPEIERLLFEDGDRVVSIRFPKATPVTVCQVEGDEVTVVSDDGKISKRDAAEMTFYFEPNAHPYPELYLADLERSLQFSLQQLEKVGEPQWSPSKKRDAAGKWITPLETTNQKERDRLEQEQETLLVKAQMFAEAHGIEIDGSGDRWVVYPRTWRNLEQDLLALKSLEKPGIEHPYPEFHLWKLTQALEDAVDRVDQDEIKSILNRIDALQSYQSVDNFVEELDANSFVKAKDEPYPSCPVPPCRSYCLLPSIWVGDRVEQN